MSASLLVDCCLLLIVVCCLLLVDCGWFVVDCWLLVVGCWMWLVVGCWLWSSYYWCCWLFLLLALFLLLLLLMTTSQKKLFYLPSLALDPRLSVIKHRTRVKHYYQGHLLQHIGGFIMFLPAFDSWWDRSHARRFFSPAFFSHIYWLHQLM